MNERILFHNYEILGLFVFIRFLEENENTKKTFWN